VTAEPARATFADHHQAGRVDIVTTSRLTLCPYVDDDLPTFLELATGRGVEVGIWITPPRWSSGLAREALRAVLPVLRDRYAGQSIVAETSVDHTASRRLLHSLGFHDAGEATGRYNNAVRLYVWRCPLTPCTTDDLPE
jgi:RimJ/RimL family protein N-acetyltransferase